MREQKNTTKPLAGGIQEPPKGGTQNASLTVEVETAPIYKPFDVPLLAGQVFYLLDRDLSEVLKENKKAIWGNLLKKKPSFSEGARGEHIGEILSLPDNPRKYPAALICTADKLARMTPTTNASYTKAIDVLRIEAVKFFIIDSAGKAEIEGLKAGIYYICGVGETSRKNGVWNVRVELKPGKNSLRLDGKNITGRQNL